MQIEDNKILKLKFKRLSTLAGENEINFTDPVFLTMDFCHYGKTGAEKFYIGCRAGTLWKTPRVDVAGGENAV